MNTDDAVKIEDFPFLTATQIISKQEVNSDGVLGLGLGMALNKNLTKTG
jgi:hypothetical protein